MNAARDTQAGVTLIETLIALSVFALIGLAGFSVLDTIARSDRQSEGRLDRVAALDRLFRLIESDVTRARPGSVIFGDGMVSFAVPEGRVGYRAGPAGILRVIAAPDATPLEQVLATGLMLEWLVLSDDGASWNPIGDGAGARAITAVVAPVDDPDVTATHRFALNMPAPVQR